MALAEVGAMVLMSLQYGRDLKRDKRK